MFWGEVLPRLRRTTQQAAAAAVYSSQAWLLCRLGRGMSYLVVSNGSTPKTVSLRLPQLSPRLQERFALERTGGPLY